MLIAALLVAVYYRDTFTGASSSTAVAVLPFVNEAGGEDDTISDGLGDALRERLMELPGLSVQARASSLSFRGANADIRTIARSLGVEVLISATLRKQGETLGDFETAAAFEPEPGVGQLWLQRRFKQLVDVGEELMLDRPDDLDVRYYLAFAHNALGDYRQARYVLEQMRVSEFSSDTFTGPRDPQAVASFIDALQGQELEESRANDSRATQSGLVCC